MRETQVGNTSEPRVRFSSHLQLCKIFAKRRGTPKSLSPLVNLSSRTIVVMARGVLFLRRFNNTKEKR
jgi:hypothetical protein